MNRATEVPTLTVLMFLVEEKDGTQEEHIAYQMAVSVDKKAEAEKGDREFHRRREGGGGSFKSQTKKVTSEQIPGGGKEGDPGRWETNANFVDKMESGLF